MLKNLKNQRFTEAARAVLVSRRVFLTSRRLWCIVAVLTSTVCIFVLRHVCRTNAMCW